jgi:hypothetical protein
MHHTSARTAITQLLAAKGFGERGLALVLAAACGDAEVSAVTLREQALAMASNMPAQQVTSYVGELLYAPIPKDEQELCRQLCPATIDLAKNIGLQLACLAGLVTLWPHVSSSERALMRQRFLEGLISDQAPSDMHLSSAQLIAWQRDLPTAQSEPNASVATLKGLLNEKTPKDAYRIISDHLGLNSHLATLSWVLGSLAVQVRLQFHDPDRYLLHIILGTVACERLSHIAPPEHIATLITQLSHQLWWCRHQAELQPIRTCIDHDMQGFHEAIASGNLTAAQRAARTLGQQPEQFWTEAWKMVRERIAAKDPNWHVALELVLVTAWRTNTDAVSPDDAAAVGTVMADLAYRDKHSPETAAH